MEMCEHVTFHDDVPADMRQTRMPSTVTSYTMCMSIHAIFLTANAFFKARLAYVSTVNVTGYRTSVYFCAPGPDRSVLESKNLPQ